ncbi:MAG: redox-regulated ATPase YchF [Anaerolineales bacterium]|nr:redox-regulated ATPase YchF [Anaerolineales bacterium]
MSLSIGIVGLPNVGKSTTFNALTGAQNAVVANYPFCTIQPNLAIVPLPDPRLDKLAEMVSVSEVIHATVEFVDIAGLVKGAHQGEGLGNQFLGQIRDTAAILHIVRCFDDPNVVHVSERPEPRSDIETIEIELALADMQQLERKIERLSSAAKGDKKLVPALEQARQLHEHLAAGRPASSFPQADDEKFKALDHEMRFLTAKPVIYVANVDENCLSQENPYLEEVRALGVERGAHVIVLCAQLEQELLEISPEERGEYLELAGVEASGLEQVIRKSFEMLSLISFFTFNERQARAWNVPRGSTAPKAAGAIHTDFERGFIRAEVIPFEIFEQHGSSAAVKAAGQLRLEGKEYLVQDGDVIYFRFNV